MLIILIDVLMYVFIHSKLGLAGNPKHEFNKEAINLISMSGPTVSLVALNAGAGMMTSFSQDPDVAFCEAICSHHAEYN